jgi:hypothetical protein
MSKKSEELPYTFEEVKGFILRCTENFMGTDDYDVLCEAETRELAGLAFGLMCEVLDRAKSEAGKRQFAAAAAELLVDYADAPDPDPEVIVQTAEQLNAPGGEA